MMVYPDSFLAKKHESYWASVGVQFATQPVDGARNLYIQ